MSIKKRATEGGRGLRLLCFSAGLAIIVLSCTQRTEYPPPVIDRMNAAIEMHTLRRDEPVFFGYRLGDKTIRFFIISTKTGPMAFLDACAACYPRKLGYEFRDGVFTCRACGVAYSATEIQTGMGSCYPIRLKGSLRGDVFLLPLRELEQHAGKF